MAGGKDTVCAIILAGGVGSRMKSNTTKQMMQICGVSVLKRCVLAFEACEDITEIVVVARQSEMDFVKAELSGLNKISNIVPGGKCRAESAICGLRAVGGDVQYIAVHDAARPLIKPENISAVIRVAKEKGAATLASRVKDTIKIVDEDGKILSTPVRSSLVGASTPQIFSKKLYELAIESYSGDLAEITDDNMLVEMLGHPVFTVISDDPNPKITVSEDVFIAEQIIKGEQNV